MKDASEEQLISRLRNRLDESMDEHVGRKQSHSDLQSRLKTRKLLGVGEVAGDHGNIYRSKISQLLGINESLYVRFPKGLLWWNSINTLYFYIIGLGCVLLPTLTVRLDLGISLSDPHATLFYRLYGCSLLAFGLLFRSILLQRETRSEIGTLLLSVAFLYALQLIVLVLSGGASACVVLCRAVAVVVNLVYHSYLDGQGGVVRQLLRWLEEYSLASTPVADRAEKDKNT